MRKVSENVYAIEAEDRITIIREGGGDLDVLIGDKEAMNSEDGPHTITSGEMVLLTVVPVVPI